MNKSLDSQPQLYSPQKSTYRFVICVDVEESDLSLAYSKLYHSMKLISSKELDWESTDEAYFEDGEEVDPNILQKAREFTLNNV